MQRRRAEERLATPAMPVLAAERGVKRSERLVLTFKVLGQARVQGRAAEGLPSSTEASPNQEAARPRRSGHGRWGGC